MTLGNNSVIGLQVTFVRNGELPMHAMQENFLEEGHLIDLCPSTSEAEIRELLLQQLQSSENADRYLHVQVPQYLYFTTIIF